MIEYQKREISEYFDCLNQEIKNAHNVEEIQDAVNKIYFYAKGLIAGFKVGEEMKEELEKNGSS